MGFIKEHAVQGVIVEGKLGSNQLSLIVIRKDSVETPAIVQFLSEPQRGQDENNPNWITQIASLREGGLQSLTLATWILLLVLQVGLVILPGQVAEEKEKIFLGLLCRHQSSARILGFVFYLPLLLPSAVSDFSKKLSIVAPFLPSYRFFSPLHDLMFDETSFPALIFPTAYLLVLGLVLLGLSCLLVKKRWLTAGARFFQKSECNSIEKVRLVPVVNFLSNRENI
jgi:hypothetical protein